MIWWWPYWYSNTKNRPPFGWYWYAKIIQMTSWKSYWIEKQSNGGHIGLSLYAKMIRVTSWQPYWFMKQIHGGHVGYIGKQKQYWWANNPLCTEPYFNAKYFFCFQWYGRLRSFVQVRKWYMYSQNFNLWIKIQMYFQNFFEIWRFKVFS